jgi:hypothetical protein
VNAAFKSVNDLSVPVTITTVGEGTYDPITDSVTGATTETLNVDGIVTSFTAYEIATSAGTILFNDIKLVCNSADLSITVDTTSTFTINGDDYRIVNPANTGRSSQGITSKDFVRVFQLRAF